MYMCITDGCKGNGIREILENLLGTKVQMNIRRNEKIWDHFKKFLLKQHETVADDDYFLYRFQWHAQRYAHTCVCDGYGNVQKEQKHETVVLLPIAYSHNIRKIELWLHYVIENEFDMTTYI